MATRSPKRRFSTTALERWFELLSKDWERHFNPSELARGRELYRSGGVHEIELGEGDAIIHGREETREFYALVEWKGDGPHVRSSVNDPYAGHSLAAAGLYEIEELVADEISPLPRSPQDEAALPPPPAPVAPSLPADAPARPLQVRLTPTLQGLLLDAYWQRPDGQHRPAFHKPGAPVEHLTPREREKLIRLTSLAHKAGFVARPRQASYLLADVAHLVSFVRDDLARWQRLFGLTPDARLTQLAQGVRTVLVEAKAERTAAGLVFAWKLRVEGHELTPGQTREVVRAGRDAFLHPELGLLQLESGQADILHEWLAYQREPGTPLPPYLIFSLYGQEKVRVALSPELRAWRDSLLHPPAASRDKALAELLPSVLRPYQRKGVHWLRHVTNTGCGALLADEMGLGKTLQAATLLHLAAPGRHLVVCPASVVPVWRAELERFFPELKVEVLKSGHDWTQHPGPAVWLASYTQLRRHRALLDEHPFAYAILDEAQFIKNPEAKVTAACLAVRADHRLVLTGTPLENRQLDLWTLFRFLMPGLLGSRSRFEAGLLRDGPLAVARLRQQIAPFVLRRVKREVLSELPPKVESVLHCPLTELQQKEYCRLAEEGVKSIGNDLRQAVRERSIGLFTLLTRLRQVCCDPGLLPWQNAGVAESGKLTLLAAKAVEVLGGGHKMVVFSQFVSLLNRARVALHEAVPTGTPIFELTGHTTDRARPVNDFQRHDGPAIILVSLKAGGTGITLHAADYVFLLDPWWNPAVEEQAIDRVHRIGQRNTVFVYRMLTHGTVEERIEALKSSKRELFRSTVGNLADMTDFGTHFQSLSDLIALSGTDGEH